MPMGTVPVDRQLAAAILERSTTIVADEEAHASEHSLEVQILFLQQVQPHPRIVPIVVGHLPYGVCQAAARDLAGAIAGHGNRCCWSPPRT